MTWFLIITFGLGWGWEAVTVLVLDWSMLNPLVQIPAACAPAIAAFAVRRWITREGFADSGSAIRWRAAWRYYLLAWLGPLAIAGVVIGAVVLSGRFDGFENPATIPLLLVAAVAGTFLFWGEEFGWTGYLLVRISPGHPRRAALLAGLIAGVWHWPLAFLGYMDYPNIVTGLLGWTLWIMCQEVLLAWLRERSGSIWPACLAHAGNNFVLGPVTAAVLVPAGLTTEGAGQWLIVTVLAAVAAIPFLRLPTAAKVRGLRAP